MIYDTETLSRRRGPRARDPLLHTRWPAGATVVLLALILLVGAYLRSINLADWDARQFLHPDERFVTYAVSSLQLPRSIHDYFDSASAPLNPRNYEWSRMWVYGTLPTTITRVVAGALDKTPAEQLVVVGRALSVLFDLLTGAALFLLGRRLYGRSVALLAVALYSVCVMPIQQSHFFTMDNFGVAFVMLALVSAVRLSGQGRWYDAIAVGVWIGAATASKINLASSAMLAGVAVMQLYLRSNLSAPITERGSAQGSRWGKPVFLLGVAGLTALLSFRIFQPDAFTGPGFFGLRPEARFLDNLRTVRSLVSGEVDFPPAHQWANRVPYLFALNNMVVWGMGIPLGLMSWAGFLAVVPALIRARRGRIGQILAAPELIPWLWIAAYFAWQGRAWNPSMRYFLPIYAPLLLFAAWGALAFGRRLQRRYVPRGAGLTPPAKRALLMRLLPAGVLLVLTAGWAWGFSQIYRRPNTRIAAAQWMLANAPHGSSLTTEQWDDALPYTNGNGNNCEPFCLIETTPFAEDEPSKFLGQPTSTVDPNNAAAQQQAGGLIGQISRADYIVLSSARVYTSIDRLPHRFPATLNYYRSLFDGSLGYDLVADFHSFPSFFGLPIPDLSAEEQFTVYDHPRVLIFRRTERFSPDKARDVIMGSVKWDEIYKISALTTSSAPTALRLTARQWSLLDATDARYLFAHSGPLGPLAARPLRVGLSLALWLGAIELLGLAGFGILWRFRVPVPDRGFLSARLAGLLLFAVPPALVAASGRFGVGRLSLGVWYGLVAGFGLRLLVADRGAMKTYVRGRGSYVVASQALYLFVLALALGIRWRWDVLPSAPNVMGLAQWAALLRSPVLPPPDPLFAGGQLVIPYASLVPLAQLGRLVGLEPAQSLNLALVTAAALLVCAVVAAVMHRVGSAAGDMADLQANDAPGAPRRRSAGAWIAGLLVLFPGISAFASTSGGLPLTPLGALASGLLGPLAAAGLAASAIVWARSVDVWRRRPAKTWPPARAALAPLFGLATLGLLLAHDRWVFFFVLLPVGLLVYQALTQTGHYSGTVTLGALGAVVVGAVAFSRPFSVLPATSHTATTAAASPYLFALCYLIAGAALYALIVGPRLVDRGVALVAGGLMLGWAVVGVSLGWPLWMIAGPAVMLMLWLALEAVLAGRRRRRAAQVLGLWLGGLLALVIAERMEASVLRGEPATLTSVAVALGACGAGLAYPALGLAGRRLGRRVSLAAAVVFLIVSVLGVVAGRQSLPRAVAGNPPVSPELAGAIGRLAIEARGAPVVALAPTSNVPAAIARTGLPALLAAPTAEASLRAILGPAFDPVSHGRSQALADIFGQDVGTAAEQLASYGVQYVLLGPDERSMFGPEAGAALRKLAAQGTVQAIYDQRGVTLFRHAALPTTLPIVAKPANLQAPSLKRGLLDVPLAQLPIVGEYAWNRAATASTPLAILLWLLLFELVGLLAWPLCRRIFTRSLDAGWAWSKTAGWLIWGYAIWLPVSLGWWTNRWPAVVVGLVVLAACSWLAIGSPRQSSAWRQALALPPVEVGRHVLRTELLYLAAFAVWVFVRAANPDLWHPTFGGEKPFEFGMLNAIIRSPVMPPPDPFFSGGLINYYYYGLFLAAVPIRATGLDPAIAFNLLVPTLFALVTTGAAAIVRDLTGRWRWGMLGAAMVAVLGPIASAVPFGESRGLLVALRAARPGLAGWGGRLGDWFWGPSRVIPHTINEFPFFSYLFADLHPHMIALVFTLLVIALAVELSNTGRQRLSRPALWLAALVLGTLAAANSWDAPTSALVLGGALVGRAWRLRHRYDSPKRRATAIAGTVVLAAALLVAGLMLFLPFFMNYQAMVGGIGRVRFPDTLLQFVSIYGLSLYVSLTLLAGLGWVVSRRATRPLVRRAAQGAAAATPLLTLALLLGGATIGRKASPAAAEASPAAPVLAFVLLGLAAFGVALLLIARLRDEEWMNLWLITAGLLVAFGIQLVFVRDHLAGGEWERMNTVFKFGLQIWTLLALGAASALPLVLRLLRRAGEATLGIWIGVLLLLMFAATTYPAIAVPSRLAMRFEQHPGLTLDGLAYMQTARYEQENKTIELRWDADAIRWLKDNLSGLPIVLQSEAEFYRHFGVRIAAATGFPTVVSGLHEDEQRPGDQVAARVNDVRTIYSTPDPEVALRLLEKYKVDYVYVGPAERAFYDAAGLAKWEKMIGTSIDRVFENPGVQIYRVRPGALPPEVRTQPPVVAPSQPNPQPDTFKEPPAFDPRNASAAFGAAQSYLQAGRLADAARVLSTAAAANPRDVPLHHFLGDVQADLGHTEEAIAAWRAGMDADPSPNNMAKLAVGLVRFDRYEEAERLLHQAIERAPSDPLLQFYLGELYQKRNGQNDAAKARQQYQTYLDQSPPDSPFRAAAEQALRQLAK